MGGIILLHAQEAIQESEGGALVLVMPVEHVAMPKAQDVVVGHAVVVQGHVVRLVEEAVGVVHVAGEEEEEGVAEEGGEVVEAVVEEEDVEAEMDKGFICS